MDYDIENETVDGARLEIIIKLLPHDPFSRYFVTEAQFDLREIKFYTKVKYLMFIFSFCFFFLIEKK